MNTFDPVTHTYTIAGRVVPSVTQVLRDTIPGWSASAYYLGKGQAVHAAAAFIARGVDFDHDPQITGEVAALRLFFAQVKPSVLAVEQQVWNETCLYGGTLDLLTRKPGALAPMLVDYKATLTPAVPWQLAAYSLAFPGRVKIGLGVGVEIRPDGTYAMSEVYDLKRYQQGWLALLTAYGIRRACGINQGENE